MRISDWSADVCSSDLFDVINIKLDKCGGLTEGLLMARRARELGKRVMVGNMCGTSLAAATAFVLGQFCDVVDLDGPTFLAADRAPSVRYEDDHIPFGDEVWRAKAASSTQGQRTDCKRTA